MSSQIALNNTVRIWLGIRSSHNIPPNLAWYIDEKLTTPKIVRPLSLVNIWKKTAKFYTFTGLFEFNVDNYQSYRHLKLELPEYNIEKQLTLKTLANQVRDFPDQTLKVLMLSCYSKENDKLGLTLQQLLDANIRPDLILLMGDQVYLDMPVLKNLPSENLAELCEYIDNKYWMNWQQKSNGENIGYTHEAYYGDILSLAPWLATPDDHEFWNNYPHRNLVVPDTFHPSRYKNLKKISLHCFMHYQSAYSNPNQLGLANSFDIAPLSFFIADIRSQRQQTLQAAMSEAAWNQFSNWQKHVQDQGYFGVIVTGQSLLSSPTPSPFHLLKDGELANYNDYPKWLEAFQNIMNHHYPHLLLTGDVHYGAINCLSGSNNQKKIIEVISSPLCLLDNPITKPKVWLGRVSNDPWPEHPRPPKVREKQLLIKDAKTKICFEVVENVRGNHATLLSFHDYGGSLDVEVTRFVLHKTGTVVQSYPIKLHQMI